MNPGLIEVIKSPRPRTILFPEKSLIDWFHEIVRNKDLGVGLETALIFYGMLTSEKTI